MVNLRENLSFDQANIVLENANEGKDLYMKGICIQGGVRNANQRVYPVNEIGRAVKTLNEQIQGGYSVLGEVDHPEGLNINLPSIVTSKPLSAITSFSNSFVCKALLICLSL